MGTVKAIPEYHKRDKKSAQENESENKELEKTKVAIETDLHMYMRKNLKELFCYDWLTLIQAKSRCSSRPLARHAILITSILLMLICYI